MTEESQTTRGTVEELAHGEINGHSRLQMLIAAFTTANFMGILAILMYLADLVTARVALKFAFYIGMGLFTIHVIVSNIPAIARVALRAEMWVKRHV